MSKMTNSICFFSRRKASLVPGLWQEVQLNVQPEDPLATALGFEALQVRQVQGLLHPVRPPEAAPPAAQQRETLHLLRLRQVLHQRVRTSNPLEDRADLQAEPGRPGDQR